MRYENFKGTEKYYFYLLEKGRFGKNKTFAAIAEKYYFRKNGCIKCNLTHRIY